MKELKNVKFLTEWHIMIANTLAVINSAITQGLLTMKEFSVALIEAFSYAIHDHCNSSESLIFSCFYSLQTFKKREKKNDP